MDPQEIAQAFVEAYNAGDFETASTFLADDFQFSGPVPEPVGKEAFIGLSMTLSAGLPDLNFDARVVGVEGNVVKVTHQLSGTHTADLDLTAMGMDVVPATGKSFSAAVEHFDYTVEGDKIVSFHTEPIVRGFSLHPHSPTFPRGIYNFQARECSEVAIGELLSRALDSACLGFGLRTPGRSVARDFMSKGPLWRLFLCIKKCPVAGPETSSRTPFNKCNQGPALTCRHSKELIDPTCETQRQA
jgi:predicted ester cyclase